MTNNKVVINTTAILWVCFGIYFMVLIVGLIHAKDSDYIDCALLEKEELTACVENSRAAWGQFGDFLGGFFNPIVGLFTIYLLVSTIRQQSRALDQTEIALAHANAALAQNERALEQNANALDIARQEITIARQEIQIGREIQAKTEEALQDQLDEAKSQNRLANHFKYLEEFEKFIPSIRKNGYTVSVNIRNLYSALFPNSRAGSMDVNPDFVRLVSETTSRTSDLLEQLNTDSMVEFANTITEFIKLRSRYLYSMEQMGIKYFDQTNQPGFVTVNVAQGIVVRTRHGNICLFVLDFSLELCGVAQAAEFEDASNRMLREAIETICFATDAFQKHLDSNGLSRNFSADKWKPFQLYPEETVLLPSNTVDC